MVTTTMQSVRALVFVFVVAVIAAVVAVGAGSFIDIAARPHPDADLAARDEALAWTSRVFLVLALVWIAIGAIATRTTLVRRPGAAAARATWLASTRPWRARESMLGLLPLDRALIVLVPAGLVIVTRLLQRSFDGVWSAFVLLATLVVFAAVMILLVRPRSPWPVLSSMGGVVMLLSAAELLGYAVAGPYEYWQWLWHAPVLVRVAVLTVMFGLIGWTAVAACGAASSQVGPHRATGAAIAAAGASLLVFGGLTIVAGAAATGTVWHDELITVRAPAVLIWTLVGLGLVCVVVGTLIARGARSISPADD